MTEEFGSVGKKCSVAMEWVKDLFVMLALVFLFLIIHMTDEPDDYFLFVISNISVIMICFGTAIGFLDKLESLIMSLTSLAVSFLITSTEAFDKGKYLTYTVLFIRGAVVTSMSFAIGNLIGDWLRMFYDYVMCRRSMR